MNKLSGKQIAVRVALTFLALACAALAALAIFAGATVRTRYADRIVNEDVAPEATYAVVLGASVSGDKPSPVLQDRLDTAIDLLKHRRVMGIAVTGDDGQWKSDERGVMLKYLKDQNIPSDVIYVDDGAYRTYDSCANLKNKGITDALLITQRFHLPRALYLCNEMGVHSYGVEADRHWYPQSIYYWIRDFAASPFAYFDVRGVTLIKKGPSV